MQNKIDSAKVNLIRVYLLAIHQIRPPSVDIRKLNKIYGIYFQTWDFRQHSNRHTKKLDCHSLTTWESMGESYKEPTKSHQND